MTGAIPVIPASVATIAALDDWIIASAAITEMATHFETMAARMRMTVAVMDRAAEIGRRQRGEQA